MPSSPSPKKPGSNRYPSWATCRMRAGVGNVQRRAEEFRASDRHSRGKLGKEEEFLKGNKTVTQLLAGYDPARMPALAALLQESDLAVPTLVWERGATCSTRRISRRTRAQSRANSWKSGAWKRSPKKSGRATRRTLSMRVRIPATDWMWCSSCTRPAALLAGTDTPTRGVRLSGLSAEELQRFVDAVSRHLKRCKPPP